MMTDAERTSRLWERLKGLFGADAVSRKFGAVAPAEWAAALRSLRDFEIDRGIARLTRGSAKSPPALPEFMRLCRDPESGGAASADGAPPIGNPIRDHWRGCVVHDTARAMGLSIAHIEPLIVQHRATLGQAMRDLLDELTEQDILTGRTAGMHEGCVRRCGEIARQFAHVVPAPKPQQSEGRAA
jgi:hypothetical protein